MTAHAPSVFVIRIWFEATAGRDTQRGYVEHIATGHRRYFAELSDAFEFVAALGAIGTIAPTPNASSGDEWAVDGS